MRIKHSITISMALLSILACIIPGVSQPVPGAIDPDALPTIVVLTANAAMTQTAAVPSPMPAETPTRQPLTAVTTLETLPDGRTKFTDNEAGYEITFPAGWLTLRPNSEEFNSALIGKAAGNEALKYQMEYDLGDYEPELDRLYSYPLRPDIEKNFAFGYSELEWHTTDSAPIDESEMGHVVRTAESSSTTPGFRVDTARVYENANQVKLIEVGGQFSLTNNEGTVIPYYYTAVYFKPASESTVLVVFSYFKDYQQLLQPDANSVITSIKLLNR